jgi:hypothetical protein
MEAEEHLLRLCNATGGPSALTEYEVGDESVECLRDMKRLLREDDKTGEKSLLRLLGEWQFLKTDLIPILKLQISDAHFKATRIVVHF